MKTLRVLIVDDEEPARRRLQAGLRRIQGVEVVGAARNAAEAKQLIESDAPEVLLLDVEMPGGDGFTLIESLSLSEPPAIIFVTAFDRYSLDAFSHSPIDFVLKPVDFGRLAAAVERARVRISDAAAGKRVAEIEEVLVKLRSERNREHSSSYASEFWVDTHARYIRVRAADIEWVQAERDFVRLHLADTTYLYHELIGEFEKRLDPSSFRRVHRSAIIRLDAVQSVRKVAFNGLLAILASGAEVRVGRTYLKGVRGELAPG